MKSILFALYEKNLLRFQFVDSPITLDTQITLAALADPSCPFSHIPSHTSPYCQLRGLASRSRSQAPGQPRGECTVLVLLLERLYKAPHMPDLPPVLAGVLACSTAV